MTESKMKHAFTYYFLFWILVSSQWHRVPLHYVKSHLHIKKMLLFDSIRPQKRYKEMSKETESIYRAEKMNQNITAHTLKHEELRLDSDWSHKDQMWPSMPITLAREKKPMSFGSSERPYLNRIRQRMIELWSLSEHE